MLVRIIGQQILCYIICLCQYLFFHISCPNILFVTVNGARISDFYNHRFHHKFHRSDKILPTNLLPIKAEIEKTKPMMTQNYEKNFEYFKKFDKTEHVRRKRQMPEKDVDLPKNQTLSIHDFIKNVFRNITPNQLPNFATIMHKLKNATERAAKATNNLEKIDPNADFWTQVLQKAVKILHYAFGVNRKEAKTALNFTITEFKDFVDDLAVIKYKVDEKQKIMQSHLQDLTIKVLETAMGEDSAKAAADYIDFKKNIAKMRNNLKHFGSRF